MLKKILPWALLTAECFVGTAGLALLMTPSAEANVRSQTRAQASVQLAEAGVDLSYTFNGDRIPLVVRDDQLAVKFVAPPSGTRSGEPDYLKLQRDLNAAIAPATISFKSEPDQTKDRLKNEPDTKNDSAKQAQNTQDAAPISVSPLGSQYALVEFFEAASDIQSKLYQQPYVADAVPVLTRPGSDDSIVATSEIVVSFEQGTSDSEARALLEQRGLKVIRPLMFMGGRYLVEVPAEGGIESISAAQMLNTTPGIRSATPNFVQSLRREVSVEGARAGEVPFVPDVLPTPDQEATDSPFPDSWLPWQWHLNSEPLTGPDVGRTDVRAMEAWAQTDGGEGVVVAVIDSLIQWDHPDLVNNLYVLPQDTQGRLPGETSGWDFSNNTVFCEVEVAKDCAVGDADTRIDAYEVNMLRPGFQNTLTLDDSALLSANPRYDEHFQETQPELDTASRATLVRQAIQSSVSSEFHGTWSAGVIAAHPQAETGVVGVAPNAKILPIRALGIGGSGDYVSIMESIGYAIARGADVINLSLGGPMPGQELADLVSDMLVDNPDVVIVASAGNDDSDIPKFPAAVPGVVSVGATNVLGNRTFYSNYGETVDVVAPGGETTDAARGGILTTSGVWEAGLMNGLSAYPAEPWGNMIDPLGRHEYVQGTSFSAPVVSGVMALMMGADDGKQLNREALVQLLQESADYEDLAMTAIDEQRYRQSGSTVAAEQYFFGSGLVDAAVAVKSVKQALK